MRRAPLAALLVLLASLAACGGDPPAADSNDAAPAASVDSAQTQTDDADTAASTAAPGDTPAGDLEIHVDIDGLLSQPGMMLAVDR